MELNICAFLNDAVANIKRYWKSKRNFAYTVQCQDGEEMLTCSVAILGESHGKWVLILELPPPLENETYELMASSDVWRQLALLQAKYCQHASYS